MPLIEVDGRKLNVEVTGAANAPVLMLSNSLGTTLDMWAPQMKPFTECFRLVRYDRRGHGESDAPPGPYSMERLGRDVLGILDHLGIETVDWCGLSMGGMVGQWLGANAPTRDPPARARQHRLLLSGQGPMERAHCGRTQERHCTDRGGYDGSLVQRRLHRARAGHHRPHEGDDADDAGRGLHRLLRGRPRHGSSRPPPEDQGADADDRGGPTTWRRRWRARSTSRPIFQVPR